MAKVKKERGIGIGVTRRELVTIVQGLMILQHVMGTAAEVPDDAALRNFLENEPELLNEAGVMALVIRLRSQTF